MELNDHAFNKISLAEDLFINPILDLYFAAIEKYIHKKPG